MGKLNVIVVSWCKKAKNVVQRRNADRRKAAKILSPDDIWSRSRGETRVAIGEIVQVHLSCESAPATQPAYSLFVIRSNKQAEHFSRESVPKKLLVFLFFRLFNCGYRIFHFSKFSGKSAHFFFAIEF